MTRQRVFFRPRFQIPHFQRAVIRGGHGAVRLVTATARACRVTRQRVFFRPRFDSTLSACGHPRRTRRAVRPGHGHRADPPRDPDSVFFRPPDSTLQRAVIRGGHGAPSVLVTATALTCRVTRQRVFFRPRFQIPHFQRAVIRGGHGAPSVLGHGHRADHSRVT